MQAGLQARGAGRERRRARDLLHDSSWHSREEEAEREREEGDSFPLPSPTHSLPAFPSLAGGKGGREAGRWQLPRQLAVGGGSLKVCAPSSG